MCASMIQEKIVQYQNFGFMLWTILALFNAEISCVLVFNCLIFIRIKQTYLGINLFVLKHST